MTSSQNAFLYYIDVNFGNVSAHPKNATDATGKHINIYGKCIKIGSNFKSKFTLRNVDRT